MYSDDEEKRGFPIRDFLIKLVLIVIFVLLLMWLLPTRLNSNNSGNGGKGNNNGVDLTPLTNRIFAANINEMKSAAIPYFTTERLPKNVGDETKLTLQKMLDLKLLLPFTDKNGDSCDTQNSYVQLTKEENEYLMKVYLKCNDDEDYILVHIGCYSYCDSKNGVCEKQEPTKKPTTKKPTTVTPTKGPNCVLEIASGTKGSNGWYVGNVKVRFKSKSTAAVGAKITAYGITTSSSPTYNGNSAITISKEGTTRVYGYVKDSNGKTAVCTITVKKDTQDPDCRVTVTSGTKNSEGHYVGNVTVGFSSRTDKTSGVAAYGMGTSSKASYNSKKSYTVSGKGNKTVYGYVKDYAGHTKTCKTSFIIDEPTIPVVSKPSCELQIKSGTLGDNNWYRSNVVVSFKSKKSTNGATIKSFGLGTSENYKGATTYTVSTDGASIVVKGFVKDTNGYTATCSISFKRDATKPTCALSVTQGTKKSDGTYTSDIVLGFKSRYDATSGVSVFGIGKSITYANNTSYTVTTSGTHTVYGYLKDKAGNTNVCSITVTKVPETYEYQYSKYFATQYSAWSAWTTKEYTCTAPPSFKKTNTYEAEDLGKERVISGYTYKVGKAIFETDIKETGVVSEKSCANWSYYRSVTNTTKTYAIKVADDWKYVGLVSLTTPPTNTLSTKYEFVGMDWDRCGTKCTTTPYTIWKKYTRSVHTVTATDTITSSSGVTTKCTKYETKNTTLFSTYSKLVGYEKERTPIYKDVCKYKYRTRTVIKEAYTDYKWSIYNDQNLLNQGYKMTGNRRLVN